MAARSVDHWLEQSVVARQPNGRRHLLFISPVPVVHSRFFKAVEGLSTVTPLADDLRDQWEAGKHRGERARLIMTLLEHQQLSKSAVTILSGDVHMGVHAEIRSQNPLHLLPGESLAVINQLTSSGIVHPPPSRLEYFLHKKLSSEEPDDLGQHVETRIVPLDDHDHLTVRNWLYLDFDRPSEGDQDRARLWAEWRAGEHTPSRCVVVQPPAPR